MIRSSLENLAAFDLTQILLIIAVTLSKTKKRGKEQKESLVTLVRGCLDEYTALYVFSFENMRNSLFKEFKDKLKTSSR